MEANKMTATEVKNRTDLDAYAWPGGYQITYVARDGFRDAEGALGFNPSDKTEAVCCAKCAKDVDRWPDLIITGSFVHWEGPDEYCEFCSAFIQSEYGDPDMEGTNK